MRFTYDVQGVSVGIMDTGAPSDAMWHAHCEQVRRHRSTVQGVLIYSAGGSPTPRQRVQLRKVVSEGGGMPPVAMMTSSPIVRGVITSLNWFQREPTLAAFAQTDFVGACCHLEARGVQVPRALVADTLRSMAMELGIPLVAGLADEGAHAKPDAPEGHATQVGDDRPPRRV